MKALLKIIGIVFVIAGVVLLAYSEFSKIESNTILIWSAGLVIAGLVAYIITNRIFET